MIDFMKISTRQVKKGVTEIFPKFVLKKSSDLMIRGGDFYAVWNEDTGLWSTDEEDVINMVDAALYEYTKKQEEHAIDELNTKYMWDSNSGSIDAWHKYCQKQMRDNYHPLDEKIIFGDTKTNKKDYASRTLSYPLRECDISGYEKLMSMQVLRTMAKAQYDDRPIGHFGLSLADYCHFTSPIRRYPDTSIHRILSALVGGMSIEEIKRKYEDFAKESAKQSSEREVRAENGERDTEKCYAAEYMTAHIGECYDGVVEGVTAKGIFVSIPCGIEGFVNLSRLENAFFEYNGTTTTIDKRSGISYSIGDSVRIKVTAATVALGTIDYELV